MAYTTIDDGSAHFQTTLYTGDGNDPRTVTNGGNSDLQPDWVIIKYRTAGVSPSTYDSTRGATKRLFTDFGSTEATLTTGVKAFNTDGFTVGDLGEVNTNNVPYVAWQWHCNSGTTSSNTEGNTTNTLQVNTTAGFSISTFTSASSGNTTIGHGLGGVPEFFMIKARNNDFGWWVNHVGMGDQSDKYVAWNTTGDAATVSWGAAPTSTLITLSQAFTASSKNTVCYAFKEKQGYSKFGKYTGNGNADGTFVYTGFKPAFFVCKRTDNTGNWLMFDNKRDGINPSGRYFYANGGNAEFDSTTVLCDFVSNGVKVRSNNNDIGTSNATYIFLAFAENPFTTSTGIPTTAR
jgi:hypothetical protein